MRIVVVGAGLSGLACAQALQTQGHSVILLDKGRGAGGRMASRRVATALGEVTFDHGAQYFTVRDRRFAVQVQLWAAQGLADRWPAAGDDTWVGIPAMNAPLKALASGLDVRWGTRVQSLSKTANVWTVATDQDVAFEAEVVVVALPSEQAADLIAPVAPDRAAQAQAVISQPCWTVMLAFAEPLPGEVDCLRGDDAAAVGWAARNRSKPGRTGPDAWVVQGGPVWSAQNLEATPDWVQAELSAALSARLGFELPQPIAASAHRWRYARSGVETTGVIWDADQGLGFCGDWLVAPRVEGAWLSGTTLADRIVSRLTTVTTV